MYLRSDEAGCYHNNYLIAALPSIGERTGISVRRFDHSELQHGKDICDRILCPMKAAIRTFCNEGHDILTANDMLIALTERQVKGTTAAVCSVDESNKNAEVRKLEGFSKFTTSLLSLKAFVSGDVMGLVPGSSFPTSL